MGDIIGAILGTSSSQTQQTQPDAVQQAINLERLNQIANFFPTSPLNSFSGPSNVYDPTYFSTDIASLAKNSMLAAAEKPQGENNMSLWNYRDSFNPVLDTYEAGQVELERRYAEDAVRGYQDYNTVRGNVQSGVTGALDRSYSDYNSGIVGQQNTFNQTSGDITADYNAAIARGDYDLARSLMVNDQTANRALGVNEGNYLRGMDIAGYDANSNLALQDRNRARALELGIGATDNYVSQIATPRLKQELALQGLETSGAVPVAIARATAEQAMPYLQSLESAYATNQANTLNQALAARAGLSNNLLGLQSGVNTQLSGQQAAATQSAAEGNRALGGQNMALQAQAGNTYQNNVAQLAQALMQNNITLEQAGISADSALGQQLVQVQNTLRTQRQEGGLQLNTTLGTNQANFAQTLPSASQTLSLLPGQQQAQNVANLTGFASIADFPRQLQEADLLRRQGLATSIYTGLPFSPGSTTFGGSATGNIFDQLGGTIQSGLKGGGNIGG